ncbi:hypothetical protein NC653_027592 [Populus alba x Populus x berolinensis]|uniref:Uncharacterized protein n=1 Tax=Populus alba x Populus x berolinensis TaxID=444605 RepID=A0AAD6M626_9ROSI|nr:hypothetical protein NC653_027592 [Populus alba x Populus x berolinensis]
MPSSSGVTKGTHIVNDKVNQACRLHYGSSKQYEDCMKAEVENITVDNVSDDDSPKATSPSLQFPFFSTNTDNQLASKAKDS